MPETDAYKYPEMYETAIASDLDGLTESANELIFSGFEPIGGIAVWTRPDGEQWLIQAFVVGLHR